MANVKIPTPLRPLTNNLTSIDIDGSNVIELIENLNDKFPGFKDKIMEESSLKHFVNIYINGEDIRYIDSMFTEIKEGDEVSIVPAVAGG